MLKHESSLVTLQQQTKKMLELARAGDWDALAVLEEQRRPLLLKVFDTTSGSPITPEYQQVLRSILDSDREVIALGTHRRETLRGQLQSVGQGRSAIRAYGNHHR